MSVSSVVINNFGADGVYYQQAPQSANPVPSVSESLTVFVGTSGRGIPGVLNIISDTSSLTAANGFATGTDHSIVDEVLNYLNISNAVGTIRVVSGDETAAQMKLVDTQSTPGVVGTFIALSEGTAPNPSTTSPGGSWRLDKSASYTDAKPVYRLILGMPGANSETFDNILGYGVSGSAVTISNTALNANIAQAVNTGSFNQAPSQYWIYSPGVSTNTPLIGTTAYVTSNGTNGSGVTTAQLLGLGTDGSDAPQGIYAARGSKAGQIVVCGLTDLTAGPTLAAFAQSEFMLGIGPMFVSGTSSSAAITAKQSNNLTSGFAWPTKDWIDILDQRLGYKRRVSNLGLIAGIVSATPFQMSPGRKPKGGVPGIISTERTRQPYGLAERGSLTTAGIAFLMPSANGGGYVLAHGQNASGLSGQDGINFIRASNNIAKTAPLILDPFVDDLVGTSSNDDTIRAARKAMLAWLNGWVSRGVIDARQVTLDNTNNTVDTIRQSQLNCLIIVSLKGVARFINIVGQVGVATLVSDVTSQFSNASA